MKRPILSLVLIAAAGVAGLGCAELLYRSPGARNHIAQVFGHGELVALVRGGGIYDADFREAEDAKTLIIAANLRREAAGEEIGAASIEREFELLQALWERREAFDAALKVSGVSAEMLRSLVAEHLQAQQWIEKQIAPELPPTEEEIRAFHDANPKSFAQPPRFRISHLFLAAPEAKPAEHIRAQEEAAVATAKRLSKGENFDQLAAELSEDEATSGRGGDLQFFSAVRMPAGFFDEVQKLAPAKVSAPVRSVLGFHIMQLTDSRPARQMSFEEVQTEVALHLTNTNRAAAVERLRHRLTVAEFVRRPL